MDITYEQVLHDPEHVGKAFEEQVPNWEPGTKQAYHALSIGKLKHMLFTVSNMFKGGVTYD